MITEEFMVSEGAIVAEDATEPHYDDSDKHMNPKYDVVTHSFFLETLPAAVTQLEFLY